MPLSPTDVARIPLGCITPAPTQYDPHLLCPIERSTLRKQLPLSATPCVGWDTWHAYELAWLDGSGAPQAAIGRFSLPASSPNLIESKSFKLYLNSLNNKRFENEKSLKATLQKDLSSASGAALIITLLPVDRYPDALDLSQAYCLDALKRTPAAQPDALQLQHAEGMRAHTACFTHLFQTHCPITSQPDWATLCIRYSGPTWNLKTLQSYLLAYRHVHDFHEHCVERIFYDLQNTLQPTYLWVAAHYTRRGGLDINPVRCNAACAPLNARTPRQ